MRTWLAVLETLQPLDCSARDELVVGPTGFDPLEAETVEVGSCSASTVRLAKPLVHAHYGAPAVPSLGSQQVTLPAGLCQPQLSLDHGCHLSCVHLARRPPIACCLLRTEDQPVHGVFCMDQVCHLVFMGQ